jgi:hypothetical protein
MYKTFIVLPILFSLMVDFAFPRQIQRQLISGESLYEWSSSDEVSLQSQFVGMVMGVHDAFNELMFCTKDGVNQPELVLVVREFLVQNPELTQKSAADLIRQALTEKYRCGKR